MLNLLKPVGKIVVGPVRHWAIGLLSPFRYNGTVTHVGTEEKEVVVKDIITKTRLWWLARFVQRFSNQHKIHIGVLFVGGQRKKV
jgi:hypothetical protein